MKWNKYTTSGKDSVSPKITSKTQFHEFKQISQPDDYSDSWKGALKCITA
jgi:hypothetical protein